MESLSLGIHIENEEESNQRDDETSSDSDEESESDEFVQEDSELQKQRKYFDEKNMEGNFLLKKEIQKKVPIVSSAKNEEEQNNQKDSIEKKVAEILDNPLAPNEVNFEDLGGIASAKQGIFQGVVHRFHRQFNSGSFHVFNNIPGVIIYGIPGTGKTKCISALATTVQETTDVFFIPPSKTTSKWRGEPEQILSLLFLRASQRSKKAILFFDEIESLLSDPDTQKDAEGSGSGSGKSGNLCTILDSPASHSDRVMLMGATNTPWIITPRFLRRLKLIHMPSPAPEQYVELLRLFLKKTFHCVADKDLKKISKKMRTNLTPSDISRMFDEMLSYQVSNLDKNRFWVLLDTRCKKTNRPVYKGFEAKPKNIPESNIFEGSPSDLHDTKGREIVMFVEPITPKRLTEKALEVTPTVKRSDIRKMTTFRKKYPCFGETSLSQTLRDFNMPLDKYEKVLKERLAFKKKI